MSFYCRGNGYCRCGKCPSAEYYRNQYRVDSRGCALPRTVVAATATPTPIIRQSVAADVFSSAKQTIDNGGLVSFSGTGAMINTTLDDNNTVTINIGGTYFLSYCFYSDEGGTLRLENNDSAISGTTATGSELVTASAVASLAQGSTLTLKNIGESISSISPTLGEITAFIVATKIG